MKTVKIFMLLCITIVTYSQNPEWKIYNTLNSELTTDNVSAIAIDNDGYKWIGTGDGFLIKFDDTNWTLYETPFLDSNHNQVDNLIIDRSENKWITKGYSRYNNKLIMFDGTDWNVFDSTNSPIGKYDVHCMAVDSANNKWFIVDNALLKYDNSNWETYTKESIGCYGYGILACLLVDDLNNKWIMFDAYNDGNDKLAKFNDTTWTYYSVAVQHRDHYWCMAIDKNEVKWFGMNGPWAPTEIGLLLFDDTEWRAFSELNSGLPSNSVRCLTTDNMNNKWIGTGEGLVKFNGTDWTIYNSQNSNLPAIPGCIAVDKYNNKWIATCGGLAVYNENGIVTAVGNSDENFTPTSFKLSQNYPNPFNPTTTIKYSIPLLGGDAKGGFVTIKVFDMLGREVATLVNEPKSPGSFNVRFDASTLPSGIYFYRIVANKFKETRKMILIK